MMTAEDFLDECIKNNIHIDLNPYINSTSYAFDAYGFGDSKVLTIYDGDDGVYCCDRFKNIEKIESFDDVIRIAYKFNKREMEKGYNCDERWLPIFVKNNMVKIKKIEKTIVVPLI